MITGVIIPTMKSYDEVASQIKEMSMSAGTSLMFMVTHQNASASYNRNKGLEWINNPNNQFDENIFFMVDDDLQDFPQDWAVRMLQVMKQYPNCVMCSPRLIKPDGNYGPMLGFPNDDVQREEVLSYRELCTACIAMRKNELRFDENFVGSGFEDNDYCRQLCEHNKNAQFICVHDLKVVHRNEMKNQGGLNWKKNRKYLQQKWATRNQGATK